MHQRRVCLKPKSPDNLLFCTITCEKIHCKLCHKTLQTVNTSSGMIYEKNGVTNSFFLSAVHTSFEKHAQCTRFVIIFIQAGVLTTNIINLAFSLYFSCWGKVLLCCRHYKSRRVYGWVCGQSIFQSSIPSAIQTKEQSILFFVPTVFIALLIATLSYAANHIPCYTICCKTLLTIPTCICRKNRYGMPLLNKHSSYPVCPTISTVWSFYARNYRRLKYVCQQTMHQQNVDCCYLKCLALDSVFGQHHLVYWLRPQLGWIGPGR